MEKLAGEVLPESVGVCVALCFFIGTALGAEGSLVTFLISGIV